MQIQNLSAEEYHLTLAALGEGWEYGRLFPAGDPQDPEGLTSMDPMLFDRVLRAARCHDRRTLRSLSMN